MRACVTASVRKCVSACARKCVHKCVWAKVRARKGACVQVRACMRVCTGACAQMRAHVGVFTVYCLKSPCWEKACRCWSVGRSVSESERQEEEKIQK